MYRILAALALAGVLAACDENGNPLVSADTVGVGDCNQPLVADQTCEPEVATASAAPATPEPPDIFAGSANGNDADYVVTGMTYDSATDQLVLDNVPFDGDGNPLTTDVYTRNATGTAFDTASSFGTFTNTSGARQYFAVFRQSPTAYSQVGAMESTGLGEPGYAGAVVQRIGGDGALPSANDAYVFTGEYAAVRTVMDENTNQTIQYVAGTVRLDVDIDDFNNAGAAGGIISGREFFDSNGTKLPWSDGTQDFIVLGDTSINFDNWTITQGTATQVINNAAATPTGSGTVGTPDRRTVAGTWEGLFAGPNGEEVAGVVLLDGDGPVGIDTSTGTNIVLTSPSGGTVRESGVFQATRP